MKYPICILLSGILFFLGVGICGYVLAETTLFTPRWFALTPYGLTGQNVSRSVGDYVTPHTNTRSGLRNESAYVFDGPNALSFTLMQRLAGQGTHYGDLRTEIHHSGTIFAHGLLIQHDLDPGIDIAIVDFPAWCPVIAWGFMSRPDEFGVPNLDSGWRLVGFRIRPWGALATVGAGILLAAVIIRGWRAITGNPAPGMWERAISWRHGIVKCRACGYVCDAAMAQCPECGTASTEPVRMTRAQTR
ncbi:hypothetical protein BH11PLA1_BH11PLA1_16680 [soil metagenome]